MLLPHVLLYTGIIDDFALWNRALSPTEAAALVASAQPLKPAPAVSVTSLNLIRSGPTREAGALKVCVT